MRRASKETENRRRIEDDENFVLATESDLKIAMELGNLPAELRTPLREIIRASTYMVMGIEKGRLLDSFGQLKPDAATPGNTMMAGVMRRVGERLDRLAARKRKARERFSESTEKELQDILKYIRGQFRFMESLDDPERQFDHEEEGQNVTCPKPANHKA